MIPNNVEVFAISRQPLGEIHNDEKELIDEMDEHIGEISKVPPLVNKRTSVEDFDGITWSRRATRRAKDVKQRRFLGDNPR